MASRPGPGPLESVPADLSTPINKDGSKSYCKPGIQEIVLNGFQLSLKKHKQAFVAYNYSPLCEVVKTDWKVLAGEELECQHIRYHQLLPEDNLTALVASFKKTHAVGVVFVNTDDSTQLAVQYSLDKATKKSTFFVILISSSDGTMLQDSLNHHDTGEIYGKIEVKNQSDVKLLRRMLPIRSQTTSSPRRFSSMRSSMLRSSLRSSIRSGRRRSVEINLKDLVKTLMLHVDGAQCVSEDLALFQHLVTAFYQYEQMAERKGPQNDGGVFRKLSKHMEDMFDTDFPFYVTIACRVHRKQQYYECDELTPFVQNCIIKFERMESQVIAETLKKFLTQENFRVMVDPNCTPTVFELLEESCIRMMVLSSSLKSQETNKAIIGHRQLYSRMLWISVAYKCHVERGSRVTVHYWKDHITSKQKMIYLNTDTIHSIRRGLELGGLLELPYNVSFNGDRFAEILAVEGCLRPFNQLRECVVVLEQCFNEQEEFLKNFIQKPKYCYQLLFSQNGLDKLRHIHPDGNLLVILQEGLLYLDSVLSVIRKRSWQNSTLEEELKQWLSLLLSLVDISSANVESYLKDFLTTKSGGVTKLFREHIKREVIYKVQNSIAILSVEHFFDLYQGFLIWPTWLVEQYLQQYRIPPDVKICSISWRDLFSEFVDRFDSHHQRSLLDFLKSVGSSYLVQCRAADFVIDLLSLDVPSLFIADHAGSTSTLQSDITTGSVSDEFYAFLSDFIQRNNLRNPILKRVELIWGSLAEHSDFQLIILNVLQEELIPETSVLMEELMGEQSLRFLIDHSVTTICNGIGSLNDISSRTSFCWGVLASCCSRIPVSDTFEWVRLFTYAIDQLGRVYGMYCELHQLTENGIALFEDSLPSDVAETPCDEVKRVFQWFSHAQSLLAEWARKFISENVNYDEVELYRTHFSSISRVSALFSSSTKLTNMQEVVAVKTSFDQNFELLNIFLIRYVPEKMELGWCGLQHIFTTYGISFPSEILMLLSKHILFPGDTFSEGKLSLSLTYKPPSSISKTFRPGVDVSLHITRELDLLSLKKLVKGLAAFLAPVDDDLMQMLVFFHLSESAVFRKYLCLKLCEVTSIRTWTCETSLSKLPMLSFSSKDVCDVSIGVSMEEFASALFQTKDFLMKLITGTVMYVDVIIDDTSDFKLLNTEHEFQLLRDYAALSHLEHNNVDGLRGFKAMLQLFQLTSHINLICDVCAQFQLHKCLEDPKLRELQYLLNTLDIDENKKKLTANDAIEKMQTVKETLCLDEHNSIQFLNLFTAVADSSVFYQFIKDKDFVGESGQALFNQQYQLITTQLQHEEYNEVVLNHLFAAFKLITPFMDQQQTFASLMSQVVSLGAYDASKQLETVNRNIYLIRLWFSKAEGDTVESVSDELKHIMETGYYQFSLHLTSEGIEGNVELLHQCSVYSSDAGDEGMGKSFCMVDQKWNDEHINHFMRKLGFLDLEGEMRAKINHFIYLNQTARKLISLYKKLRELGHPEYLKSTLSHSHILLCTLDQQEADIKVQQVRSLLLTWEHQVAQLRKKYNQLLFFSVPKLLILYDLLISCEKSTERIAKEVEFIFRNAPEVQLRLKDAIKVLLHEKNYEKCDKFERTPMHIVGEFIALLFEQLSSDKLKKRRPCVEHSSVQATYILHSLPGYSQSEIMRLIIQIYGGVPEFFEVLRCQNITTKEDLRLFLNPMRATKQPFQYLVLEVNRLSYHVQEALLHVLSTLKRNEIEAHCIHFIETGASILREIPDLLVRHYKGEESTLMDLDEAVIACQRSAHKADVFSCIELVYGEAGDGKTHYIEKMLSHTTHHMKIMVNEGFVSLDVIQKLRCLPVDVLNCAVFFNITLLPPGDSVHKLELEQYKLLLNTVSWFFFDLFLLGYVEDPATGESFRFPGGMKWAVYIEVPSRNGENASESLQAFLENFPALAMLGTCHEILSDVPYVVDEEVQLVCKYLKGYHIGGTKGIDRLYKEGSGFLFGKKKQGVLVKLSEDPDLTDGECHHLLQYYIPRNMKKCKLTQRLFIKYMNRRCEFLDNCPGFNYNSGTTEYKETHQGKERNDTRHLGSTLIQAMLNEVSDFCDPIIGENWALKPHHQLIYDFKDGGSSFTVISLHPEQISPVLVQKFRKIGVEVPSMMELYSRERLDSYLSRALDLPLDGKYLKVIDDANYVLTLDFAIKMLNIHERAKCGVPVIIEGETGVGKTALVEMLSKLWNYSLSTEWILQRSRIVDSLVDKIKEIPNEVLELHPGCTEVLASFTNDRCPSEEGLIEIGEVPDSTSESGRFYCVLRAELLKLIYNPFLSLIQPNKGGGTAGMKFSRLFAAAQYKNNSKSTAKLLYTLLNAEIKSAFHKLNIHSALRPEDVINFLNGAFNQARELYTAFEHSTVTKTPIVTIFLDEINTSSCLGLFKELIVDHTLNGEPIPENIFIVAACNPHRSNSLIIHEKSMQTSYYVKELHPSMQCLMWDYGALGPAQEREYVQAMFGISKQSFMDIDVATLTDLIVTSQEKIRTYAVKCFAALGLAQSEACARSRSCVSQRDIQRVFTFSEWLCKMYIKLSRYTAMCSLRSVLVSLGLVYYLRLDSLDRADYCLVLDHKSAPLGLSFSVAFEDEINWFIEHIDLPKGIAQTVALKENIFATVACTMTRTPLIMVGSPGSSKTLSFNLTVLNMKGLESKVSVFRNTDIFKSLDSQVYQCSHRTTSNEVKTVFSRAINRQRSLLKVPLPVFCVVFMDEAGLPEERHESLKVLHYYLDSKEVSFVGVSNHALDAAKSNRALSLFRPEVSSDDLCVLAMGCFCVNPDSVQEQRDIDIITRFCKAYEEIMSSIDFQKFFGLRDFIHFISYLRRKKYGIITSQLVMEAIERNFNGVEEVYFEKICQLFLSSMNSSMSDVPRRNILQILQSSLNDHQTNASEENQVRYKLIIDEMVDGSIIQLLSLIHVLKHANTRMLVLNKFSEDVRLQEVNVIAAVRHSAAEGHTIIMSQTDSIHESFYDLFNHRFHRLDTRDGPRFYCNISIGAHTKPCRIHPNFQCIVVVNKNELKNIPPPFLNRFEKYTLSYGMLVDSALSQLPPFISRIFYTAEKKTKELVKVLGGQRYICGYHPDTLKSLMLTLLPNTVDGFRHTSEDVAVDSIEVYFMETLFRALNDAGFNWPHSSSDEMLFDAREVFKLVCDNAEFTGYFTHCSRQDITKGVKETLHALFSKEPPCNSVERKSLNVGVSFTIQWISQWLTRLMCKRVLQLTTVEAICLRQINIPSSYTISYINHQHHFSLKSLLESKLSKLKSRVLGTHSSKLLCFTWSTELLTQVPHVYPHPIHIGNDQEQFMQRMFFPDVKSLQVHKVSSALSYGSTKDVVTDFTKSSSHNVIVLLINMKETSEDVVNHIHLLIDEIADERKLYALVLHFPITMAPPFCYNALFSKGWDFHYLHSVSSNPENILDMRLWLQKCYFQESTSTKYSINISFKDVMQEALSIITCRVVLKTDQAMTFLEKSAVLKKLLVERGVGDVLVEQFNSYWQPDTMMEYVQLAVRFTQKDINSILKNLLFDYLVYMIYHIDNVMRICRPNYASDVFELFMRILKVYPLPKLYKLAAHISIPHGEDCYANTFPFFSIIARDLDRILEEIVSIVADQPNPLFHLHQTDTMRKRKHMKDVSVHFQTRLLDLSKSDEPTCTCVALKALATSESLWEKYLEDFTHIKLHLDLKAPGISQRIFVAAFGKLSGHDVLTRLAILHSYIHVYRVKLAQVVVTLYPLNIEATSLSIVTSPAVSFMSNVGDSADFLGNPETLSIFVIENLFKTLTIVAHKFNDQRKEMAGMLMNTIMKQVELWCTAYDDMMTTPAVKDHVYQTRLFLPSRTKGEHNLMHLFYLIMKCSPKRSNDVIMKGFVAFIGIFNKFFPTSHISEHDGRIPALKDLFGAFKTATNFEVSSARDTYVIDVVEGLFAHFFSEQQPVYDENDVYFFLEIANQQHQWMHRSNDILKKDRTFPVENSYLLLSIFKFFLRRVLMAFADDQTHSLMFHFKGRKIHESIKDVLLQEETNFPCPSPFLPAFYEVSTPMSSVNSEVLQQPLAHLYFLTVLEHLSELDFSLSELVKISQSITKQCKGGEVDVEDMVLLSIENQAVVQVMIKELAHNLTAPDDSKVSSSLRSETNDIMIDVCGGGEDLGGHCTVLGMYMLKELGSFVVFKEFFTSRFNSCPREIACLESYHVMLKTSEEPCDISKAEKQVLLNFGEEFNHLYADICNCMQAVHSSGGSSSRVQEITQLFQKIVHSKLRMLGLSGERYFVSGLSGMKMAIWLCIYNDYFAKKLVSQVLLKVISALLTGIVEHAVINLFGFFLCPVRVLADATNPLLSLFNFSSRNAEDLCRAIVKMTAVAIGIPSRKSHLWFHLFEPEELHHSYISGIMCQSPLGPESYFIDNVWELILEGDINCEDHTMTDFLAGLSMQSYHLLLFFNISPLCVHLLFKHDAEKKLSGLIFSRRNGLSSNCCIHLQKLWDVLGKGFAVSCEEKNLLVEQTLLQHYEVLSRSQTSLTGRLETISDLKHYRALWQVHTFEYAWKTLRQNFLTRVTFIQNAAFVNIQSMHQKYPFLANEMSLLQALFCQPLSDKLQYNLQPLAIFSMMHKRLQLGYDLLPRVLQLYQWLHTELSNSLTYKDAKELTYDALTNISKKRLFSEQNQQFFYTIKDEINKYLSYQECGERKTTITHETSFVKLLSHAENGEEEGGLLFSVIVDIISFHNKVLIALHHNTAKILPTIHALEFSHECSFISNYLKSGYLLQLIRSCSHLPIPSFWDVESGEMGSIPGFLTKHLDLFRIQDRILSRVFGGTPIVVPSSIESVRVPFKFKEEATLHSSLINVCFDLVSMSKSLPINFKNMLNENQKHGLLYGFHSISYGTAVDLLSGLQNIIGCLQQNLSLRSCHSETSDLELFSLSEFVMSLYSCSTTMSDEKLFSGMGICSLSESQLVLLKNLKMTDVFDCWKILFQLADDGWFHFYSLPYTVKQPISLPDEAAIMQIPSEYNGEVHELIEDVNALLAALSDLEGCIRMVPRFQVPIVHCLKDCRNKCKVISLIPDSIKVEQYVHLRLILNKMINEVESVLQESHCEFHAQWNECATEVLMCNTRCNNIPPAVVHEKDSQQIFILEFLKNNNLQQYIPIIVQNYVDVEMLIQSSDTDLKEIGVFNPIHRLKISFGMARLMQKGQSEHANAYPSQAVAELFKSDDDLQTFCTNVIENGLDGEILLYASNAVFVQLGVTTESLQHMIKQTLSALFQ